MLQEIYLAPPFIKIQNSEIENYYFTSDFHFNHKKILYYTNRSKFLSSYHDNISDSIKEMNELIINNMNKVTENNPEAILINCGDIILGDSSEIWNFLNKLKFKKIINIIGNHDFKYIKNCICKFDENYRIQFSNLLYLQAGDKQFTISHIPLKYLPKDTYNIHGHLHSPENLNDYQNNLDYQVAIECREDGLHLDCGVDRNKLSPVSLKDILSGNTDINIGK